MTRRVIAITTSRRLAKNWCGSSTGATLSFAICNVSCSEGLARADELDREVRQVRVALEAGDVASFSDFKQAWNTKSTLKEGTKKTILLTLCFVFIQS